MLPPAGVTTADRIRTKFDRVGELGNVITHSKLEVNQYIIVTLISFML